MKWIDEKGTIIIPVKEAVIMETDNESKSTDLSNKRNDSGSFIVSFSDNNLDICLKHKSPDYWMTDISHKQLQIQTKIKWMEQVTHVEEIVADFFKREGQLKAL